jgi:hypothetical protein
MSERSSELRQFYEAQRINDQVRFYTRRKDEFERATGQALAISAMLLGFSSAVGALAGTAVAWARAWSALAAILPAVSTALAAYIALYAFEQQSKIYGDAARAVQAASRNTPRPSTALDENPVEDNEDNTAELVRRVEEALRQEQAQWGQLTSQTQISDQAKG